MNPLLMEDIVDGLFKKLTIEDLKICRSVCLLWNLRISAHLKKYWKDLKNIEFYNPDEVERFEVTMVNSKDKKIFSGYSVCLSVIKQLDGGELKFFTQYQPKFLNLCLKHCKISIEDLVRIFKLSSASVEKLVLTGWGPIECHSPGPIDQNQWLDFKFPKLTTVVSNFLISSDVCLEIIQIIQEIFEKSPNLTSVESHMPKYPLYNCGLKSCGILRKLTQLTISFISWKSMGDVCQNDPEDLIHMQNHGMRLKYLNLGYYVYDQSDGDTIVQDLTTIENFLQVQCGSLESIKIVINTGSNCKIQLPIFNHCRKLDVGLFEWISELDLAKQFQQLDTLILRILSGNLDWTKLFSSQGLQVRNLEVCDKSDHLQSSEDFNIESIFPNISHLKICSSTIPIINFEECKNWRVSLKSMSIVVNQEEFANFDYTALSGFDGLKRIEFLNSSPREYKSFYWETNLNSLMKLDNIKFIKLYQLVVSKHNLAQLRQKYIVDYIPGKLHPDEHLLIDLY